MKIILSILLLSVLLFINQHTVSASVQCVDFNNPTYYNYTNPLYNRIPICYIKAVNQEQVREALLYAKSLNKGVSIRSGGHSGAAYSILNGTINIDLSQMKYIRINTTDNTAVVSSGTSMMELYNATQPYNLTTPGGSCPTVNVGGIALGGGSNYFSASYGYLVDNVLEFTVVTVDGSIVKANPYNKYSDLYYALAGAGQAGFGIVVDYKIQLHPMQQYFYKNTVRVNNFTDVAKAIKLLDAYVMNSTQEVQNLIYVNVYSLITLKTANAMPSASITFFFNGPIEQGDLEFRKLASGFLCPNTTTPSNVTCVPLGRVTSWDVNTLKKTFFEVIKGMSLDNSPLRQFTKNRFVKDLSSDIVGQTFHDFMKTAASSIILNKNLTLPEPSLNINGAFFYHGGVSIQPKYNSKTGKPLNSFVHRDKYSMWSMVLVAQYSNILNDGIFAEYKSYVNDNLDNFGNKVYNNYVDDNIEDWADAYYGKHVYKKLQKIKAKYDPEDYFKYPQSIRLPKKHHGHHNDNDHHDNDHHDNDHHNNNNNNNGNGNNGNGNGNNGNGNGNNGNGNGNNGNGNGNNGNKK